MRAARRDLGSDANDCSSSCRYDYKILLQIGLRLPARSASNGAIRPCLRCGLVEVFAGLSKI